MNVKSNTGTETGQVLKAWREVRGLSQLDLSLVADVSARHISFIETGRSKASRDAVLAIALALEIPVREVNVILVSAGFLPEFGVTDFNDPSMHSIKQAFDFLVNHQMPNPAWAIDGEWNLFSANHALIQFQQLISDEYGPLPNIDPLYHPDGLRKVILNWNDVSGAYLRRIQREILQGRSDLKERFERILAYPGIPTDWCNKLATKDIEPIVKVILKSKGSELTFLSVVSTFGSVVDVSLEEAKIESLIAANDVTRKFCESYLGGVKPSFSGL